MPNCVEIFCGLGGLSQGFCQAGYDLKLGLEIESEQLETFSANHPGVPSICKDIRTVPPEEIAEASGVRRGKLDVLLGGPPCQGFSTYGRRSLDDPRNSLYAEYAKLIEYFSPSAIVLENVIGILSINGGGVVREILKLFKEQFGYTVTLMVLDAANYGVPQFRRRVFFVGYKGTRTPHFPHPITRSPRNRVAAVCDPTSEFDFGSLANELPLVSTQADYNRVLELRASSLKKEVTVRDAISDLPAEAFKPRETNTARASYKTKPQTEYQAAMRSEATAVLNHAAKQHLLRRQTRTLLMSQGDYGNQVHERLDGIHKVAGTVRELAASADVTSIMRRARSIDVRAENAFLKELTTLDADNIDGMRKHIISGGFANKYRKLDWDRPSHTLVAHMARDCSDFIHPQENRPISVREAARLQSFPDSFVFCSSQFRQFRGIGNSVPPLLASAVAGQIAADLKW